MAKKKYYAVAEGRGVLPNIYTTWDKCKEVTERFNGAKFSSFTNIEDALEYLANDVGLTVDRLVEKCPYLVENSKKSTNNLIKKKSTNICKTSKSNSKALKIYVDGSYRKGIYNYAYGFVVVLNNNIVYQSNGVGNNEGAIALRNVAGEMTAAMRAVLFAKKNNYKELEIYYDYKGLENWAKGSWKRKNEYTRAYHKFMKENMKSMNIEFIKVKAHSGDKYNEMADKLAKDALDGIKADVKKMVFNEGKKKELKKVVTDEMNYLNGLSEETREWAIEIIKNSKPNVYHSVAAIINNCKDKPIDEELINKYYEKYSGKRTYLIGNISKLTELFYHVEKRIKK
ncbi:ribonuclease H family protein [Wukongibacter baidiensis]